MLAALTDPAADTGQPQVHDTLGTTNLQLDVVLRHHYLQPTA